jgi:hypothetical protein
LPADDAFTGAKNHAGDCITGAADPNLTWTRICAPSMVLAGWCGQHARRQDLRANFERRRIMPPPFIGVLFLPGGMSQGFISVALGYALARQGISIGIIAGLVGLRMLPDTPVVLVTMLIGTVQVHYGSSAMLLTEGGLGAASVAIYALLVVVWRPAPALAAQAAVEVTGIA